MAKNIALVIQEDPRKTHRPVEALRIALGLLAGSHRTTVILLGEAARLLSEERDNIVDAEILEQYLPSLEHLKLPFVLQTSTDPSMIRKEFVTRYETDDNIHTLLESMDRTLVF
ncbi:MAG: hypothetical protein ACT4O4_11715 [Nitrospiraceae bacterium]